MITVDQLRALPRHHDATITTTHLDSNGHMNVQWYMGLYDSAAWSLFARWGMDQAYWDAGQAGIFALDQYVRYLHEVRLGQRVAVHARLLAMNNRRVHYIMYMINESTGRLASTLEDVSAHVDLAQRRTTPFPPAVAARIADDLARQQALPWQAVLCGAMSV